MTLRALPPDGSGRGCEAFAQAAALRGDRELGPAETAALEAHLAVCGVCRAAAARSEAVSGVLKGWDAERTRTLVAPARLRLAIRAAAVEHGRARRNEARLLATTRWATAASVLLALGGALLLGLLSSRAPTEPGSSTSGLVGTAPRPTHTASALPFEPTPRAPTTWPPSRLHGLAQGQAPEGWLSDAERALAREVLLRGEVRARTRTAFEQEHGGEPALWVRDPATGQEHLVTISTMLERRRSGAPHIAPEPRPVEGRTVTDDRDVVDTGRTVADFLGLSRAAGAVEKALSNTRVELVTGPEGARERSGQVHLLRGGPAGGIAPRATDLTASESAGFLRLAEGADDDLVAIVTDAPLAVFVPAGELVAGGRVDRVVLRGTWIPSGMGERRVVLPCAPAGTAGASHGSHPTPTGMMAGPTLRALIAQGASGEAVRAWIGAHVPILDRWGRDFSLLASYEPVAHAANQRFWTSYFLRSRARGFLVSDAGGAFLGIEASGLPPERAAVLLARLLEGYATEAGVRSLRSRLDGGSATPTPRTGSRSAVAALREALDSDETFLAHPAPDAVGRLLRLVDVRAGVVFEVVETRPGGGAALVSGLAR